MLSSLYRSSCDLLCSFSSTSERFIDWIFSANSLFFLTSSALAFNFCVPIILYDEVNKIVGCIHAGWKGAASGIIENTLDQFKRINKNAKIIAAIGPCIGKESYEVSQEFYDFFLRESEINKKFFIRKNNNKFLFDIRNYVNKKLSVSEVSYIENINFDTFKDSDNFFSYRRSKKLEQADYGRCISTISLIKN